MLCFRGEGYGVMSGVKEYVVLVEDDDPANPSDHAAPGFEVVGCVDVVGEVDSFPMYDPLVPSKGL